jgi:hypothetical protein
VTVTGTGGGLTKTATLSLTITTSGGGVVVITNGQKVTGIGAATGAWKHYKITVPASQTSLVVKTTGGTGDADLYVKLGSSPTTSSYTGKSDGSTDRDGTIANPPRVTGTSGSTPFHHRQRLVGYPRAEAAE